MEITKGIFRQPRQDYIKECDNSVSQCVIASDSLCKVSDFDLVRSNQSRTLAKIQAENQERAIYWLYNQQIEGNKRESRNVIVESAQYASSTNVHERLNINENPYVRGLHKLKLLALSKYAKDNKKSDIEIKYHNEYVNLSNVKCDADSVQSDISKTATFDLLLDNSSDEMSSIKQKQYEEVINEVKKQHSMNTKILDELEKSIEANDEIISIDDLCVKDGEADKVVCATEIPMKVCASRHKIKDGNEQKKIIISKVWKKSEIPIPERSLNDILNKSSQTRYKLKHRATETEKFTMDKIVNTTLSQRNTNYFSTADFADSSDTFDIEDLYVVDHFKSDFETSEESLKPSISKTKRIRIVDAVSADKMSQCTPTYFNVGVQNDNINHNMCTQTEESGRNEAKMNREEIMHLLKQTYSTASRSIEANLSKGDQRPQERKSEYLKPVCSKCFLNDSQSGDKWKLSKGTQMFEHITENDLYTLNWINYNLFKVNVNPNNFIIDKRIHDLSEDATCSSSIIV